MSFFQHVKYINRLFNYKCIFLFFSFIFLTQLHAKSQTIDDISNIRVEELTDDQVKKFVMEADRSGIKDDQIEQLALQKGMNPVELVKFKERIQSVRKALASSNYQSSQPIKSPSEARSSDSISAVEQKPI